MATYNGGRYLDQQLASFAAQTRQPHELVICDDQSSDDTLDIVRAFAGRAGFEVRIVRNERRLGYNRNFEKAIGLCTGDIIFVSDQDDEWFPGKIDAILGCFARHDRIAAVTNDQVIVDPAGRSSGATVLGNVRSLGYADAEFGPGCCTAIRRSLLDVLGPFPGDAVPYDYWLNIVPELLGMRLLHETPLQTYRRHQTNTSNSAFAADNVAIWSQIASARRSDPVPALAARIGELDAVMRCIEERRDAIARLGAADRIDAALAKLLRERADYAERLACIRKPRLARLPGVLRLLRGGTYGRFRGLKTAAKDLLC